MKIKRYPLTTFGHMVWSDFVEAAQVRLGVENWFLPFIDQTGVLPLALKHAEEQGCVPPRIFKYLDRLLPVKWNPEPADPVLSRLYRLAHQAGVA